MTAPGDPDEENDMSTRAERLQKAAYDAHVRGRKALKEGDIYAAVVNDQESDRLAVRAMLQRMSDEAASSDGPGDPAAGAS